MPFFSMSGVGVRRDDRRRRRGARARPVQAGARARAGDHLHRRARLDRPRARAGRDRRLERAGADAQPDPHRDGRLLEPRGRHRAGRDEPARRARQGAAAARAASTAAWSSTCRTRPGARRSSRCTRAACRSRADVDLDELAAATPGLVGRRPAGTWSTRRRCWRRAATRTTVRQKDFLDALEKIVLGPERPLLLSREDRERIAYHEGGHAILGLVVPGADPVHRVTIVPRGQALGVTYQRPQTRPLQLSRGLPARAHRRHAGRPRRRGDRLRHARRPAPRTTSSRRPSSRATWSRAGA